MARKIIYKEEIVLEKIKLALSQYGLKYFEFESIPDHGVRVIAETFTQAHLKAMFKVVNRYQWLAWVSAVEVKDGKLKFFCYPS